MYVCAHRHSIQKETYRGSQELRRQEGPVQEPSARPDTLNSDFESPELTKNKLLLPICTTLVSSHLYRPESNSSPLVQGQNSFPSEVSVLWPSESGTQHKLSASKAGPQTVMETRATIRCPASSWALMVVERSQPSVPCCSRHWPLLSFLL